MASTATFVYQDTGQEWDVTVKVEIYDDGLVEIKTIETHGYTEDMGPAPTQDDLSVLCDGFEFDDGFCGWAYHHAAEQSQPDPD